MKHRQLAVMAVVISAAGLLAGCGDDNASANDGKVDVVATIFPLADVTRQIGGEHVHVATLLGAGQTPHEFQQTAAHKKALARADLVVRVGMGVDGWAVRALGRSGAEVLTLSDDGSFLDAPAAEHEHEHENHAAHEDNGHAHGDGDPHVWLDPVFMQHFAGKIAEALIALDPEHESDYRANLEIYLAQLRQLDQDYRQRLAGAARKHFVTFHPAFSYVAARYGLEQMSIHGPDASGYGPRRLQEVIDFIREHDVAAIFIEPQFPRDRLDELARRSGVEVGVLDPLGNPGRDGYDSYLAMMRSNLESLAAALEAPRE
jgi:zinc transport system substrate-binding protein